MNPGVPATRKRVLIVDDSLDVREVWHDWLTIWGFGQYTVVKGRGDATAEVRWHARHGLVMMAAEAVMAALFVVIAVFASVAALWLGTVLIVVMLLFWFAVFGAHALAAIKGLGGSRLMLPGLTRFADRL